MVIPEIIWIACVQAWTAKLVSAVCEYFYYKTIHALLVWLVMPFLVQSFGILCINCTLKMLCGWILWIYISLLVLVEMNLQDTSLIQTSGANLGSCLKHVCFVFVEIRLYESLVWTRLIHCWQHLSATRTWAWALINLKCLRYALHRCHLPFFPN